jgi:hypothetical protein
MKARKGLREVGKEGFVSAVEREGWVVVVIYEPVSLSCVHLSAKEARWSLDAEC